ncbi:MAG: hypothetical protein COB02_05960 [Candidatus Cloacimonadota bacterium]|nr:MAG: hypothetical protein COB02_12130 [Candidatus Cloacimonadota bacterium]PCJ20143.1 MAG: hypothetical protein COB02_05960 [Candidatus Cloacimonadota bacterium]
MFTVIKVAITSLLIVTISEVSKKSVLMGGLLASLPLISILSLIWLYIENKDIQQASQFSYSVFYMVIPSLPMFLIFPWLLKKTNGSFYISLTIASLLTIACYHLMLYLLPKFGIQFS